jgi:Ser/Thr protein kinase RdoA (MazF antagonist)
VKRWLAGTTEAQAAGRVLAGFESACSLLPAERAALPALVRARLALSLANGAATAQQHPENAAYLLQTQRPGWRLLEMWEGVPDDQLLMHWGAAAPAV